jgi:bacteriorhodopsin
MIQNSNYNFYKESMIPSTLKSSFMVTYILLITTGTITLIEALRTSNPTIRHIMNLETVISVVAGYFYSIFTSKINDNEIKGTIIDWNQMNKIRYLDWSITTPLMLLSLCVVLTNNINKNLYFSTMIIILILNYTMLLFGYLGEINFINRYTGLICGFIPFFAMFYLIYIKFVKPFNNKVNNFLFGFFLFFWGLYGVVYDFPLEYKNIIMNILDCIAKCLVGIGLWIFYTHLISWNK